MNERITLLALKASDPKTGWLDRQKFAELIVEECCQVLSKETIRHDGYGYNQHALYQILRKHFGVEE